MLKLSYKPLYINGRLRHEAKSFVHFFELISSCTRSMHVRVGFWKCFINVVPEVMLILKKLMTLLCCLMSP